jgi:hypothetical protein
MIEQDESHAILATEARVFGRYLVGREPTPELVERYVAADRRRARPAPDGQEQALVAYARKHPWSVGPLDTAAALLRPDALLRTKLLRLAAILEASPAFADHFLPMSCSPVGTVMGLVAAGLSAAGQLLLGIVLLAILEMRS